MTLQNKTLLWTILLCFVSLPSVSQTKHAITHEDVWLMKRVGAPLPSPDGKWVVFAVVEPSYDEKEVVSDLWIVPADGSAKPRKLTNTKGGESGATWSPDSTKIAFSARREGDEANQIYMLDVVNVGEAVRVTSLSTGARSPQFSPDGKMLLFTSTVFPGAMNDEENKKIAAERKARKYNARVYEGFPIRNWDKWLDDTQAHLFVQSLEPGAKAKDVLAGTSLVKEKGFAGRMTDSGQELDAVWTPDGKAIVFVASKDRDRAAYARTRTDLFWLDLQHEPYLITQNFYSYSKPKFSPDGKKLYCLTEFVGDKNVYHLERLSEIESPYVKESGSYAVPKILTENFDRSVASFAISPDSQTIYLTAEDKGREYIYHRTASSDIVKDDPALNVTFSNLSIPAKASKTYLFANIERADKPPTFVRSEPNPGNGIAYHNTLLAEDFNHQRAMLIDWQPLREFTFTSKRGKQIHSFLALPPNFDENKKYPLFVVIHGGPHSMWRDQFVLRWNYHLLAAPGYVVLLTNYSGSTGFGEKFSQAIQGDPLAGPGEELNEAADEAIKGFKFIDGTRQAAGGASYGGHLANWLQATTTHYKCLISHAGLVNLESQWGTSDTIYSREVTNGGPVWEQGEIWRKQNPIRYAANFKTPMLITVGEQDFRVPLNNSLENWSVLQRQKVPSKLIVFPDANHWILKGEDSRFFYNEAHAWLKKWL